MSWNNSEKLIDERDVESYAQALWDILLELGIQDGHSKSYDPLTIEGKIAHTYVFDLEDGGRHHEFKDLEQLRVMMLKETAAAITTFLNDNHT
jgi:hypothetical protein